MPLVNPNGIWITNGEVYFGSIPICDEDELDDLYAAIREYYGDVS